MLDITVQTEPDGKAMKRKLVFIGILVTLFFSITCIYQVVRAYTGQLQGEQLLSAQIAGWVSFVLFLFGLLYIFLVIKSDKNYF